MTLTVEQVDAVKEGHPVKCLLPEAGAECVILRADVFEQMRDEYGWTTEEAWAAFCRVAGPAGWDDPEMDIYDELYGEKPKPLMSDSAMS